MRGEDNDMSEVQPSIPIPFAVGEHLWWTGRGSYEKQITCPECVGTKVVTMILGNGDTHALQCACCTRGCGPALGTITRHVREHTPTAFTPARVILGHSGICYSESPPEAMAYSYTEAKDLYRDRDECQAACEAKVSDWRTQEQIDIKNMSSRAKKDLTWSVHYWSRMVKDREREAEAARRQLNKCKEKATRAL